MCGSASPNKELIDKEVTMVAPAPSPSVVKPGAMTKDTDDSDTGKVTSDLVANYVPDRDMTKTPPPILSGKRKRTGKRGKIGKKPADMPRRPLSGYNYFFSEQKSRILEEQAKKKNDKQDIFTTLGRIVADRWKKLGDEDKEKYNELAAKDLIRYRQEMEKYNEKIAIRNRKEAELKTPGEEPDDEDSAARRRPAAAGNPQTDHLGGSSLSSNTTGERQPPIQMHGIPPHAQSATALYASPLGQLSGLPALAPNYPGLLGSGLSLGGGLQGLPLFSQQMDVGRLALAQNQSLAARLDPMLGRQDLHQLLGQFPSQGNAELALAQQRQQQQQQQQQALRLSSLGTSFGSSGIDPSMLSSLDAALLQSLNASAGAPPPGASVGGGSLLNNPSSPGASGGVGDSETLRQTYVRLLQRQQEEEEILRQLRQRGWPPGGSGGGF